MLEDARVALEKVRRAVDGTMRLLLLSLWSLLKIVGSIPSTAGWCVPIRKERPGRVRVRGLYRSGSLSLAALTIIHLTLPMPVERRPTLLTGARRPFLGPIRSTPQAKGGSGRLRVRRFDPHELTRGISSTLNQALCSLGCESPNGTSLDAAPYGGLPRP